jgi:hypothetical protein
MLLSREVRVLMDAALCEHKQWVATTSSYVVYYLLFRKRNSNPCFILWGCTFCCGILNVTNFGNFDQAPYGGFGGQGRSGKIGLWSNSFSSCGPVDHQAYFAITGEFRFVLYGEGHDITLKQPFEGV